MKLKYNYIARNQYGDTVLIFEHPRKELCEHHGVKHADMMYIDTKDGKTYHIGYVVSGNWYTVYGLEGNTFRKEC